MPLWNPSSLPSNKTPFITLPQRKTHTPSHKALFCLHVTSPSPTNTIHRATWREERREEEEEVKWRSREDLKGAQDNNELPQGLYNYVYMHDEWCSFQMATNGVIWHTFSHTHTENHRWSIFIVKMRKSTPNSTVTWLSQNLDAVVTIILLLLLLL